MKSCYKVSYIHIQETVISSQQQMSLLFHLPTLPHLNRLYTSYNVRMMLTDGFRSVWKYAVVVYFKVLSQYLVVRIDETIKRNSDELLSLRLHQP